MTAQDFLNRHGLTLAVRLAKTQTCPKWCSYIVETSGTYLGNCEWETETEISPHNHGPLYRVVIRRTVRLRRTSISFDYWIPQEVGKRSWREPNAAEVLAWLANPHSGSLRFRIRVHSFFTDAELRELSEVGR